MDKIIHIVSTGNYGALERVILTTITLLDNYEHIYISPTGDIDYILEKNNVIHYIVEKINSSEVGKIVKKVVPNIIHIHDVDSSINLGLLIIKSRHIQTISHLHDSNIEMHLFSFKRLKYSVISLFYKKVILSPEVILKKGYLFLKKNKVILPNIVTIDYTEKNNSNEYDIVTVASLAEEQSSFKFITIINELKKLNPSIKAAYIGDCNLKQNFLKKIIELNLENNIDYLENIDSRFHIMRSSKISLLTPEYEGIGTIALESLLLGLPVVTTNIGILPQLITYKVGISTNNTKKIIEEINRLLNDHNYYIYKKENSILRGEKINNIGLFKKKMTKIYNNY